MAITRQMWEQASQPQQGYAATSNPYYIPSYAGPKLWVDNGVSLAVVEWDKKQVEKRKAEQRKKRRSYNGNY